MADNKVVKLMTFAREGDEDNNRALVVDERGSTEREVREELNLGDDWKLLGYQTLAHISEVFFLSQ